LLIGSVVMMLYTDVTLAVTAILSSLAGFVFVFIVMSRSQKYFARQQDDLGMMNGDVEEIYAGQKIMKAYGGEKDAKEVFDTINNDLFRSNFMSQFLSGMMQPFMNFIGNFGYVMVCIVGAIQYVNGNISFGTIVAFIVYVRLFSQPLTQLAQAFSSMQSVAAAAERIFEFLDEEEMEDESGKSVRIDDVKGHVEFRDVHFGYIPGNEVIHGFSADILPGQKVAIVGPTGAGKTTMVNLLMRFYDVDAGDILIDGISVNRMKREDVHDLFCMVLQDTWLFEGTIRENIVYDHEDVPDERLDEVCEAVGLHHFIQTLPDGYDTVLGDNATLSAGQKQQMTIARAMIDGSPLLILDEATSSVDTVTEKLIQAAMDKLTEGRTSFVIAHRLSTIRNANLILVMREGSIVEQGTHDELLEKGGFYADLYNSQFEDIE
ncbi:MAG: ABC transporter ATP-binding protein, partial [Candidatus Methanomethylophilaceae archaeon]